MARGTTGQGLNVILLDEFSSELALVCRRSVAHLEFDPRMLPPPAELRERGRWSDCMYFRAWLGGHRHLLAEK